jgi:hypothetical protein
MTKVFCQRSTLTCIDSVREGSEPPVGEFSGELLEQLQIDYPGAEIMDADAFVEYKEGALCSDPVEITEEVFVKALEVLPPQRWRAHDDTESFYSAEFISGRVTSIYCRIGSRYFTFDGFAGTDHDEIVANCSKLLFVVEPGKR